MLTFDSQSLSREERQATLARIPRRKLLEVMAFHFPVNYVNEHTRRRDIIAAIMRVEFPSDLPAYRSVR